MEDRNLSFQEAIKRVQERGLGFRICTDTAPGIIAWVAGGTLQSNLPIPVTAYSANDWCVIKDDTVIR